MNKLRSSKLGIVFVVLAMLGFITGPALALGCCCVLPVAPHHHAAPSAMDNMPCCHQATQQTAKNQEHCATQNTPVISRNCDCPQAQAQFFVTNSTPQNGVFATSISTLPLREFAFAAPIGNALPIANLGWQKPPLLSFSSVSGRAPPVC